MPLVRVNRKQGPFFQVIKLSWENCFCIRVLWHLTAVDQGWPEVLAAELRKELRFDCKLADVYHELWPWWRKRQRNQPAIGECMTNAFVYLFFYANIEEDWGHLRKLGFFFLNTILSSNTHLMYSKDISSVLLGFWRGEMLKLKWVGEIYLENKIL